MNISNALYEFTSSLVTTAASDSVLKDCHIHIDLYEPIKSGKTIRMGDSDAFTPNTLPSGEIRDDTIIEVHFIATPAFQTLEKRTEARMIVEQMRNEWLKAVRDNPDFSGGICTINEIRGANRWINPETVKRPATVLRLLINKRKV